MAHADWFSGATMSTSNQQGFISMSTVDDLSYSPTEEEKSRDIAQVAATGRRSWKTLRGRGEAVWPPSLEAALIEALHQYQPDEVRPPNNKNSTRFPRRNRFISDYVFQKTGKRRTPKQVGSRLQQLRDTCKETAILELISRRQPSIDSDRDSQTESSHSPSHSSRDLSPTPPLETQSFNREHLVVYVNVSVQQLSWPTPIPRVQFMPNNISSPFPIYLSALTNYEMELISNSSRRTPSILHMFSNSVEFASSWPLLLQSTFTVYREGSTAPIHEEVVPLKCLSSPMQTPGWVYGCEIVPAFWRKLYHAEDPNRCTIVQVIEPIQTSHVPSLADAMPTLDTPRRSISIVYRFSLPEDLDVKVSPALLEFSHDPTVAQSHMSASTSTLPANAQPSQWYSVAQNPYYEDAMPGYSLRPLNIPSEPMPLCLETPTQQYYSHDSTRSTRTSAFGGREPNYGASRMIVTHIPESEPRINHQSLKSTSISMTRRDAVPAAHLIDYGSCYS